MATYTSTPVTSFAAGSNAPAGATTFGTIIDLGPASAATAPNDGRLFLRIVNGATGPSVAPRMTVLAHSSLSATAPAAPTALDGGGGWYVVHQFRGSTTAGRPSSSVSDIRMGPRYLCVGVGEHTVQPVTVDALGYAVSV